jgi:hypothetical protein
VGLGKVEEESLEGLREGGGQGLVLLGLKVEEPEGKVFARVRDHHTLYTRERGAGDSRDNL